MYEICVSKNGKHLFATARRSIVTALQFDTMLTLFREKFPRSEGYELSVAYAERSSVTLPITEADDRFSSADIRKVLTRRPQKS